MRNWPITFIAIAALVGASPGIAAPALFGIELQEVISQRLPPCHYDAAGKLDATPCRHEAGTTKTAWGTAGTDVLLGPTDAPGYLRSLGYATAGDGRVIAVAAATLGAPYQLEVLAALKAKFGRPSKATSEILTNSFGVRVRAYYASWDLPGATLRFEGLSNQLDWGRISLDSREYVMLVEAWKKQRAASTVKP